jgi:hypothetical protein
MGESKKLLGTPPVRLSARPQSGNESLFVQRPIPDVPIAAFPSECRVDGYRPSLEISSGKKLDRQY